MCFAACIPRAFFQLPVSVAFVVVLYVRFVVLSFREREWGCGTGRGDTKVASAGMYVGIGHEPQGTLLAPPCFSFSIGLPFIALSQGPSSPLLVWA